MVGTSWGDTTTEAKVFSKYTITYLSKLRSCICTSLLRFLLTTDMFKLWVKFH